MVYMIIKSIFDKIKLSCFIFTLMTVFYGGIGFYVLALESFTPKAIFINLAISFITGFGSYVFLIPRINTASKHILYFIINYTAFILLQGIVMSSSSTTTQIFILSIFLFVVYGIVLLIYFIIKRMLANIENKKSKYQNQFNKLNFNS